MAEKAFTEIEAKLQAAVSAAQERVESCDESKLQDAFMRSAQVLAHWKSTAANCEADNLEAKMKFQKANEKEKSLLMESTTGEFEHSDASRTKDTVDGLLLAAEKMKAEQFTKRDATKVTTDLKSFGVDASLLATLHGVITKPVEERGEFDALTLSNLDSELAEKRKVIDANLSELEPARVQREAGVAVTQAACDAARGHLDAAKVALAEAESGMQSGEMTLRAAEAELKGFVKNLKTAQDMLKAAEKKLADFQNGALQNFRALESHHNPSSPQLS